MIYRHYYQPPLPEAPRKLLPRVTGCDVLPLLRWCLIAVRLSLDSDGIVTY